MISAPSNVRGLTLFEMFVHEIGKERVCSMLDVHSTTLLRWLRGASPVPRMAVLALYWETQYGKSMIDTDQVNEIRLLYQRIHAHEAQYTKAKDIVAGLRRLHTGTANEPIFEELPDLSASRFEDGHYGHTSPEHLSPEARMHQEELKEATSHVWPAQSVAR